jgi:hypothetical protein
VLRWLALSGPIDRSSLDQPKAVPHHKFADASPPPPASTPAPRTPAAPTELQGLHREVLLRALKALEGQGKVRCGVTLVRSEASLPPTAAVPLPSTPRHTRSPPSSHLSPCSGCSVVSRLKRRVSSSCRCVLS